MRCVVSGNSLSQLLQHSLSLPIQVVYMHCSAVRLLIELRATSYQVHMHGYVHVVGNPGKSAHLTVNVHNLSKVLCCH